jgi:hypothetical protein
VGILGAGMWGRRGVVAILACHPKRSDACNLAAKRARLDAAAEPFR